MHGTCLLSGQQPELDVHSASLQTNVCHNTTLSQPVSAVAHLSSVLNGEAAP